MCVESFKVVMMDEVSYYAAAERPKKSSAYLNLAPDVIDQVIAD